MHLRLKAGIPSLQVYAEDCVILWMHAGQHIRQPCVQHLLQRCAYCLPKVAQLLMTPINRVWVILTTGVSSSQDLMRAGSPDAAHAFQSLPQ